MLMQPAALGILPTATHGSKTDMKSILKKEKTTEGNVHAILILRSLKGYSGEEYQTFMLLVV